MVLTPGNGSFNGLECSVFSSLACSAVGSAQPFNVAIKILTCDWNRLLASERQHCRGLTGVDFFIFKLTTWLCELCQLLL